MSDLNPILLKNVIEKLIKSIMSAEIIKFKDSIWFIDREKKFWFFEFDKGSKHLWWRWHHFTSELKIFSINEESENARYIFIELFSKIIKRKKFIESKYGVNLLTVSDVMNFYIQENIKQDDNSKIETGTREVPRVGMEEILNQEVKTADLSMDIFGDLVEDVLDQEVVETVDKGWYFDKQIDEVLSHEVETTSENVQNYPFLVQEILNKDISVSPGSECNERKSFIENFVLTVKSGTMVYEETIIEEILNVSVDPSNNQALVDGVLKNT